MNRKIVKLSCLTLTLMIVLSSIVALQNVAAQGKPKVFVDPPVNEFSTKTTPVGTSFTVSIKAADWVDPGVYGYQLNFAYDSSMLQFVSAAIPAGTHWFTPADPTKIFIVDAGTPHNATATTNATVSFAVSLLNPEVAKTGGGVIATVTLKIIATPATGTNLTSLLQLTDVIMVDPTTGLGYPESSFENDPATFNYVSQVDKPTISASKFVWSNTAADAAGRLFNINVSIEGLAAAWHAVAFEFRLSFNKSLISTKTEWVFAGDFIAAFGGAGGTFNISLVEDDVFHGQIILPPWPDPNELDKWAQGSGVLATIQFSADYRPPPEASCALVLSNVVIVDYLGVDVPSNKPEDGEYKITVAEPPWLSVDPQAFTFNKVGDELSVNAQLNSIVSGFKLVGAEFKMRYNTAYLTISAITEGTFMKDLAQAAGTDTFFQSYIQEDYGLVGIIILPLPDGTWPDSVFPNGTGTLATLKFTSIFQDPLLDISTSITVFDGLLVNVDAKEILIDQAKTTEFGTCQCTLAKPAGPTVPPAERIVDLFTQYVSPYGGQGLGVPSDAFGPQGQVSLFANVTYRGEGVPNKPVSYQISGPNGFEFFGTAFSDAAGIAAFSLNIPASDSYFGIWNVYASVDIAGQVVSDYVFFRVGWLVSTKAISIRPKDGNVVENGNNYQVLFKGRTYKLNSTLTVLTMQPPEKCVQLQGQKPKVLIIYTGFDELSQPIFAQYVPLSIPDYNSTAVKESMSDFVAREDGRIFLTEETPVIIPTTAFSGIATIFGNIYTEFPWSNGVAYANPALGMTKVFIRAASIPTSPPLRTSMGSLSISKATVAPSGGSVTVGIGGIDPDAHIVAVQFSVKFNTKLFRVTNVTAGSFVQGFGNVYLTWQLDGDVLIGMLQLPPWPGANGWMSGDGSLVNIELQPLAPKGSDFMMPFDAFLVDAKGNTLGFDNLISGFITIG